MKLQESVVCVLATYCALALYVHVEAGEDLYKVLGLKRDATDKQIKKAFRKMALKYHPDKNKDPDAKDKFLKIGKAYDILGDPEKKKKYDMYGDDGEAGSSGGHGGFHQQDFDQFFKHFDEAMNAHKQGGHYKQGGNGFHSFDFGHSGGFFNFDDLFHDMDPEEETLFFGGGNGNKRRSHGGFGGSDIHFGDFGFGDDLFGDFDDMFDFEEDSHLHHHHSHHSAHHKMHHQMHHQGRHTHQNFHQYTHSSMHQQKQQRCQQVTQRVGNQVITFTQCS